MIEIGKTVLRVVRHRIYTPEKPGGILVPTLSADGGPEKKLIASEVVRVTRNALGGTFGPDGKRKLVVKLAAGDVLVMWPQGTRQKISIELKQVYREALQRKAMLKVLERARQRKAIKANQRASRRLRDAERRLVTERRINNVGEWAAREALG